MPPAMFSTVANPNIWNTEFLEDNPIHAYNAYRPQRGVSVGYEGAPRSFFDYFRNRQGQTEQEFIGERGRLARSGQPPNLGNVDFLADYPWLQRWMSLTPEERGVRSAQPLRWNIPR